MSVQGDDAVKIYNLQNLADAPRAFALARPGRSAVALDGTLWIIQEKATGAIRRACCT